MVDGANWWWSRQALLGGEKNKVRTAFSRTSCRRQTPWAPPVLLRLSVIPHPEADILGFWRTDKFLWPPQGP